MEDFEGTTSLAHRFWPVTMARIAQNVRATRAMAERLAAQTQEEMRTTAPWRPVGSSRSGYKYTGAARDSLTARVRAYSPGRGGERRWRIELYYDDAVLADQNPEEYDRKGNYGAFLEARWGGRYAIVQPTAIRLRQAAGRELRRIWTGVDPPVTRGVRINRQYQGVQVGGQGVTW